MGCVFVMFGILGLTFLTSLVGAFFYFVAIIVFFIASGKLVNAIGADNSTALRVATLTKRLAISLSVSVGMTLLYTVVNAVKSYALLPVMMVITNIGMPMGFGGVHVSQVTCLPISLSILLPARARARNFTALLPMTRPGKANQTLGI